MAPPARLARRRSSPSPVSRHKLDPPTPDLADHPLSLELVGPHLRTLTPDQIRADFAKLVETKSQKSDQPRNTSLLASLEFSRRHLTPATRAALPWLALFSGGVFEENLLDVSQIAPPAWDPIRTELQAIALLRPEYNIQLANRPFLSFHPTLAIASADSTLAEKPETRERFRQVYLAARQHINGVFGSESRTAMQILDREEMNYRTAVHWAVADGQHQTAAHLGQTFWRYLQMSNRLRERDAWVQMLRDVVTEAGFTREAAAYERAHAWTLLTQGDPQGAIDKLQALVHRLRQTTDFEPAFQFAQTILELGSVLNECGASAQAIPVLREAIGLWEQLVERAGGQPWKPLLASPDHAEARNDLVNLATTMGDLGNALCAAGRHDEALEFAENAFAINERLGNHPWTHGDRQWPMRAILVGRAVTTRPMPAMTLRSPPPVRQETRIWRE